MPFSLYSAVSDTDMVKKKNLCVSNMSSQNQWEVCQLNLDVHPVHPHVRKYFQYTGCNQILPGPGALSFGESYHLNVSYTHVSLIVMWFPVASHITILMKDLPCENKQAVLLTHIVSNLNNGKWQKELDRYTYISTRSIKYSTFHLRVL